MRQTISGLVAVLGLAVSGAAPAMACGDTPCAAPCGYASPCAPVYSYPPAYAYTYSGCGACGASYERLAEPTTQYYYVNQGPTYTGPGNFAPYPAYREGAVSGWGAYRHHPYHYGYAGGRYADAMTHEYDGAGVEGPAVYSYRWHHHHPRPTYRYGYRRSAYHWGYTPYYHGRRVLRRYD
jgi:hypothetical protein